MNQDVMFVEEVAQELRRCPATIRRYIRLKKLDAERIGALPGQKGGGKYNITRESVMRIKNGH